jgi:RNA polymerase sigma factor (sigma-70 family)
MNDPRSITARPDVPRPQDRLADLLARVAQRDIAALSGLYHATSARLLAVCQRFTDDRTSAEDVLQEVYLKVWNRASGYDRARAEPMVWLVTLARHSAIDWYRAQARRPVCALSEAATVIDDSVPADEALIGLERDAQVATLVDDLRGDRRALVRAVYFEGLTYAELATREGLPLGTVKSRMHRILAGLGKVWPHD